VIDIMSGNMNAALDAQLHNHPAEALLVMAGQQLTPEQKQALQANGGNAETYAEQVCGPQLRQCPSMNDIYLFICYYICPAKKPV
jgi:hypothetical protein